MRNRFARLASLLTVFLLVGALIAPAASATYVTELHQSHQGTVAKGVCEWHFVQTKAPNGSGPISLTLKTSRGWIDVGESVKIQANGKNQHWTVTTYGWIKLKKAFTDTEGKLVLSDLTCAKRHYRSR